MASLERVKEDIAKLAQRRNAVEFSEIKRIVEQLGKLGYSVAQRRANETYLFRVSDHRFGVCTHNRGDKHVKACYVKEFLETMGNLGLFDGE